MEEPPFEVHIQLAVRRWSILSLSVDQEESMVHGWNDEEVWKGGNPNMHLTIPSDYQD